MNNSVKFTSLNLTLTGKIISWSKLLKVKLVSVFTDSTDSMFAHLQREDKTLPLYPLNFMSYYQSLSKLSLFYKSILCLGVGSAL